MARRALVGAIGLASLAAGCQWAEPPDLLRIERIEPGLVSPGDRVQILGSGFPAGRHATVSFRGDVLRPGQLADREVRFSADAEAPASDHVVVVLDDLLERSLCGPGVASRATFRGTLRVAFAPGIRGAPPVTGTLDGVVLDVAPCRRSDLARAADAERAQRFAEFLGITVRASPRGGLALAVVLPDGRADRAGLEPGDEISDLDGATVLTASDLFPPPGTRTTVLSVRREGIDGPIRRSLDIEGFAAPTLGDLAPVLGVLAVVGALLVAPALSLARAIRWAGLSLSPFLTVLRRKRRSGRQSRAELSPSAASALSSAGSVSVGIAFAVCVALGLLAASSRGAAGRLDVFLLVVIASVVRIAGAVVAGGAGDSPRMLAQRPPRWSLRRGLGLAFRVLALESTAVFAIAASVLVTGGMRAADVVWEQGAAPWRWNAFSSPILFVATCLLGLSACAPISSSSGRRLPRASSLAESTHLLFLSSAMVLAMLGGWRLPFISPAEQASTLPLALLGAAAAVGKLVVVTLGAVVVRSTIGRGVLAEPARVLWLRVAPLGAAVLVWSLAWMGSGLPPAAEALPKDMVGGVLVALAVLGVGAVAASGARGLALRGGTSGVNPWL